ncbi:MAG: hypothetical protein ACLR6I_06725 [Waltera sp.]
MDQKLENILNLALETPEEERKQTESLNVGYSAESRSWELIVKYHGSLDGLREQNIVVEELIAGYAILTVPETLVDTVSETPEIEYVEKPKRFYYQQTDPDGASCFPPVTRRTPFLNGRGVLLAVLDSGITWDLEVFRKADGSTRIRYLWDRDDTMGSDDSGSTGRITGAGDAAESGHCHRIRIMPEETGDTGIWEDTGWISHRD